MKTLYTLGLLLVCGLLVHAAEITEEEGVIVLTDDNFDEVLKLHPQILVEFYAPWCGHCKQLAPEYAKAAGQLKAQQISAPVAKLDATVHKKVAEKFRIGGYPTLKWFSNGNPTEYSKGRTANDIVAFIKKQTTPPSEEASSVADVEKKVAANDAVAIFFGETSSSEFNIYSEAAKQLDETVFVHTTNEDIAKKYQVDDISSPKLLVLKKFDEGRAEFTGRWQGDDVRTFLDNNQFPLVMSYSQKVEGRIARSKQPSMILVIKQDADGVKPLDELKASAEKLKKMGYNVIQMNFKDNFHKKMIDTWGVPEKEVPTLRIIDSNGAKYKLDKPTAITSESIMKFAEDHKAKKIEKYLKSEDIPASSNEPVKVIVGKTYESIVLDTNKDVLMEFYAPWCGHCKKLVPIYDAVAKKVAHIPNLVIAKMDSTANEVPNVGIRGYPTIKFFPSNKKKAPIDFSGDRTEEGFINFLKQHMTVPFIEASEGKTDL